MTDEPRDPITILKDTADALRPLLRSHVHLLPQELRHLAGLHFGWWTDDGTVVDRPAEGKALRPALVLLACRAMGGSPYAAQQAAVAVELLHNASMLHDDIVDQDQTRRGRTALWVAKGIPAAIIAGDSLFFTAVRVLTKTPHAASTLALLLDTTQTLLEGAYNQTNAKEQTLGRARRHATEALEQLAVAGPEPTPAAELVSIAHLVTHRDH